MNDNGDQMLKEGGGGGNKNKGKKTKDKGRLNKKCGLRR